VLTDRRNLTATVGEIIALFPQYETYSFIPFNTELGSFGSGAKLYRVGEQTWCIKGSTEDINAAIAFFLRAVRRGGTRKEDRQAAHAEN
jgi:hypothetical protein